MLKNKFNMKYVRTDIQFSFVGIRGLVNLLVNPFLRIVIAGIHKEIKDFSIEDRKVFR